MIQFSEKDWKLFCRKIVGWQESYMDKLNREYIEILSRESEPSDRFWTLEERIHRDKHDCGVQCRMSRSNMFYVILSLQREGAITFQDLDEFSDELKEAVQFYMDETV